MQEVLLRQDENGMFYEYEPYTTIYCDNKESAEFIETAIERANRKEPKKGKENCFVNCKNGHWMEEYDVYYCPNCNNTVGIDYGNTGVVNNRRDYCDVCGQHILWNDEPKETPKRCMTEDCPYQTGDPCNAAEGCGGFEWEEEGD